MRVLFDGDSAEPESDAAAEGPRSGGPVLGGYEEIVTESPQCSGNASQRSFLGNVLGYVTPWNNRGYGVAETFAIRFTNICLVWYMFRGSAPSSSSLSLDIDPPI